MESMEEDVKSEVVDQSSDEETTPSVEELQKANEGLIRSIQEERRKKQDAIAQKIELETMVKQNQEQGQVDNEELVTRGDILQLFNNFKQEMDVTARKNNIKKSIAVSKEKYKDFDEIAEYANQILTEEQWNVIGKAENPGELLYMFGRTHPDFISKQDKENSKKNVTKIKENLSTPQTLSAVGGGGDEHLDKLKQLQNLNIDDIKKMGDKVLDLGG